jgi:hypothetical protein
MQCQCGSMNANQSSWLELDQAQCNSNLQSSEQLRTSEQVNRCTRDSWPQMRSFAAAGVSSGSKRVVVQISGSGYVFLFLSVFIYIFVFVFAFVFLSHALSSCLPLTWGRMWLRPWHRLMEKLLRR